MLSATTTGSCGALAAGRAQGKDAPVKYWLSNLPADTPIGRLVQLAKLRWRVEHDYRELKQCLGLDHYERRSYRGCITTSPASPSRTPS
jgi:SRSO17 transposase